MRNDVQKLIASVRELAERGNDHERELAQKKLEYLINKYGDQEFISEDEVVDYHTFYYGTSNWLRRKLLVQVICKVLGSSEFTTYYQGHKSRSKIKIKCTKLQSELIQDYYDIYSTELDNELQLTFSAFVQKNRIFPAGPTDDTDYDPEYIQKLRDRMRSMNRIDDELFDKSRRIECNPDNSITDNNSDKS